MEPGPLAALEEHLVEVASPSSFSENGAVCLKGDSDRPSSTWFWTSGFSYDSQMLKSHRVLFDSRTTHPLSKYASYARDLQHYNTLSEREGVRAGRRVARKDERERLAQSEGRGLPEAWLAAVYYPDG